MWTRPVRTENMNNNRKVLETYEYEVGRTGNTQITTGEFWKWLGEDWKSVDKC